jgi:uncharacterized protein with von Willebrand factor type A (vWA) domain
MAEVIKRLNGDGMPCYIINMLRRKINIELIKLEDTNKDMIDIERFKQIFISTIRTDLSETSYNMFLKCIFDEKMEYL